MNNPITLKHYPFNPDSDRDQDLMAEALNAMADQEKEMQAYEQGLDPGTVFTRSSKPRKLNKNRA